MKKHFIFIDKLNATQVILISIEKQEIIRRARKINLSTIADLIQDGEVNLIISDHLASNHELELSAKNQTQMNKVARYAVENKFPGKLEDYHIVAHKKSSKNVSVRAISHARIKTLMQLFSNNNISLSQIFVESDLLKKYISTLLFSEQEVTLCGGNLEQTYEFDKSVVPIVGDKIFAALEDTDDLQIIFPEDDVLTVEALCNQAPDSIRLKNITKDERYYENLCLNFNSAINLLQGEYKTSDSESETNSFWKLPIYLGASSLLLLTGGLFAQNYVLKSKTNTQESTLAKRYIELFPNASEPSSINDLRNKLRSKLRAGSDLPKSELPIDALNLLKHTSIAASGSGVKLKGLNLDKNSAELLITGASIEALNSFKETFAQQLPDKTILMDSVNAVDSQYQGKISLK